MAKRDKQNSIDISGVVVISTTESLKVVEETASRLVEKHKDFLISRRKLRQVNYV